MDRPPPTPPLGTVSRRGRGLRAVVRAVIVALLAGLGLVGLAPAATADALWNHRPVTYNMQGATTLGEGPGGGSDRIDKWSRDVARLLATHDVVALQEAGNPPAGAYFLYQTTPVDGGPYINTYRWRIGSGRGSDVYIHWVHTDIAGNRTNLATVTRQELGPGDIRVVANPNVAGRPAIGVRLENFWFYNVHAFTNGGSDAPRMLRRLAGADADAGTDGLPAAGERYLVMGDMNREPGSFELAGGGTLGDATTIAPREATHQSGATFDWMVTNSDFRVDTLRADWGFAPRALQGFLSDHRPVDYVATNSTTRGYRGKYQVMPLGSSTTYGSQSSHGNGYRADFANGLGSISGVSGASSASVVQLGLAASDEATAVAAAGAAAPSVDMVGSVEVGTAGDRDNEGWPGYEINAIAGKASCAVPVYQPNLITLLAGGNDVWNDRVEGAPDRLAALIDQVSIDSPGVVVLVAGTQPYPDPARNERSRTYNAAIPGVVERAVSSGLHVVYADTGLTVADIGPDGNHPTDAGYRKIADAFLAAYQEAASNGWMQEPNPQAADVASDPCGNTDGGAGTTDTSPADEVEDPRWEYHGVSFKEGFGENRSYRWGDVNRDGKPEMFVVEPDQSWTFYWNSGRTDTGWTGWTKGITRRAARAGMVGNQLRIADMDGDGRADCVTVDLLGNAKVAVWDDTKPPGQQICGKPLGVDTRVPGTGEITDAQILFPDVNGDGYDDYMLIQPRGTTRLWLNNWMSMKNIPEEDRTDQDTFWEPVGQIVAGVGDPRIRRWADINGDGRADQIVLTAKGGARAWLNKGFSSAAGVDPLDPPRIGGVILQDIGQITSDKGIPTKEMQFVDVGGDGKADLARTAWTGRTYIWLNRLNPPYASAPLGG